MSARTSDASPKFGFIADEPDSTFECALDGGAWKECTSPKAYAMLADGGHTFRARATDQLGNTDPSPASRSFTVDTSSPPPPPPSDTRVDGKATASKTQKQKGKKKSYRLRKQTSSVPADGTNNLKLKPSSKDAKKIAKALREKQKTKANVAVELVDRAGNDETVKLAVKLKR